MIMKEKVKLAHTPNKVESSEQKIYNLIILDESGSMNRIKEEAISGLNETFYDGVRVYC